MAQGVAASAEAWIDEVVGKTFSSDWLTVDQSMIDQFADATRDWNFLHVDGDAARKAGMERTIAHGFLTLSLLSPLRMQAGLVTCPGLRMGMNYGLDRVRFVAPVREGDCIRGQFTTNTVEVTQPGHYRESIDVLVEIQGQDRPALVATWIALYIM